MYDDRALSKRETTTETAYTVEVRTKPRHSRGPVFYAHSALEKGL